MKAKRSRWVITSNLCARDWIVSVGQRAVGFSGKTQFPAPKARNVKAWASAPGDDSFKVS